MMAYSERAPNAQFPLVANGGTDAVTSDNLDGAEALVNQSLQGVRN
jgi:hypothetical protein